MLKQIISIASLILFLACSSDDDPIDPQLQLDLELGAIDNYLDQFGIVAGQHESGVRYVIKNPGDSLSPTIEDSITVNYIGRILDGGVFGRGDSVTFLLSDLILGWQYGVPLIQEGGSIDLYIPSALGYGPRNNGLIPGNSTLFFDVDLLKVIPAE